MGTKAVLLYLSMTSNQLVQIESAWQVAENAAYIAWEGTLLLAPTRRFSVSKEERDGA